MYIDRLLNGLGYIQNRKDANTFISKNIMIYQGDRIKNVSTSLIIDKNAILSLSINSKPVSLSPIHIIINKPVGYTVSRSVEESPLVFDLLPSNLNNLIPPLLAAGIPFPLIKSLKSYQNMCLQIFISFFLSLYVNM